MEKVLIVTSSDKSVQLLEPMLDAHAFPPPYVVHSGREARVCLETSHFDLVIINTPLPDEFGDGLFELTKLSPDCDVIMLVKHDLLDEMYEKNHYHQLLLFGKPLQRTMLDQSLRYIYWRKTKEKEDKEQVHALEEKIKETNLINRAKLVLMSVLKLTEAQAHRYIEKQAMDMRISRRQVAEGVLNTYEN